MLKGKVSAFHKEKKNVLQEFQKIEMDTLTMQKQAEIESSNSYVAAWKADADKHACKISKTVEILLRAIAEEPAEKDIADLLKALDAQREAHEKLVHWAERFGIQTGGNGKSRKVNKSK